MATEPRNTPADVRDLFHTDISDLADSTLNVHLRAASHKVDRIPTDADGVNDGLLADVELYLACARVESQVLRPTKEAHESAEASYDGSAMDYEDIAEDLDPTGTIGDDIHAEITSVSINE